MMSARDIYAANSRQMVPLSFPRPLLARGATKPFPCRRAEPGEAPAEGNGLLLPVQKGLAPVGRELIQSSGMRRMRGRAGFQQLCGKTNNEESQGQSWAGIQSEVLFLTQI